MPDVTISTLLLFLVDWGFRLGFALHILLRRRPLAVTLTWIAIVLVVPVAGIVLYLFFGQLRLGEDRLVWFKRFTHEMFEDAEAVFRQRGELATRDADHAAAEQIQRFAAHAGHLPALSGNHVDLIADTDAFLDALIAELERAERSAFIQTYIWQPSARTQEVVDAIAAAARRGVDCRVLADGVGAYQWLASESRRELKRAGARIVSEMPVGPFRLLFRRLDIRNHRKIAVFDGRVAFVGSHNLTDSTFGTGERDSVGPWIDASVRIEGPAAQALQLVLLRDWEFDASERVISVRRFMPDLEPAGGAVAQVIPSGPGINARAFEQTLLTALYSARREALLVTPYFVPDEPTQRAITAAAGRGVRVVLLMPRRNDSLLVASAAKSCFPELLRAGVEIHEYTPALLHAKLIAIDDTVAFAGSSNLDMRSFELNLEVMLALYDRPSIALVRAQIERYLGASERIDPAAWESVSIPRRLGYNLANLASQIL